MFKAWADSVDITAPVGTWLTGYGARIKPSTGIHDPVMARALVMKKESGLFVLVSCDLIGFEPLNVENIRSKLNNTPGIDANSVMICCTHTHSGPASVAFRGTMGLVDFKWLEETSGKIVDLIINTTSLLVPAKLSVGSTKLKGIGFNRQDDTREIDDELVAISIDGLDDIPIATIINYATHAVILGPDNLEMSGDFPGAAERYIEKIRGGTCLYIQGASGDAEPLVQRNLGWGKGGFKEVEEVGRQVADTAIKTLGNIKPVRVDNIKTRNEFIDIPLEPFPSKEKAKTIKSQYEERYKKAVSENNEVEKMMNFAMIQWAGEVERVRESGKIPNNIKAEIFTAKTGNILFAGIPFEPYSDIALEVKRLLKPEIVVFAGYTNGLYGYIATNWAKAQGGYGPYDSCRWFPSLLTSLEKDADKIVIKAIIENINML